MEKLNEIEEKAKPIIQAIQKNIDDSATEMANRNAEHQKRKQELENQIAELEVFFREKH
jgi:uncharacterized protein YukE